MPWRLEDERVFVVHRMLSRVTALLWQASQHEREQQMLLAFRQGSPMRDTAVAELERRGAAELKAEMRPAAAPAPAPAASVGFSGAPAPAPAPAPAAAPFDPPGAAPAPAHQQQQQGGLNAFQAALAPAPVQQQQQGGGFDASPTAPPALQEQQQQQQQQGGFDVFGAHQQQQQQQQTCGALSASAWLLRYDQLLDDASYAVSASDRALAAIVCSASGAQAAPLSGRSGGTTSRPPRPIAVGGGTGLAGLMRGTDAGGAGAAARASARASARARTSSGAGSGVQAAAATGGGGAGTPKTKKKDKRKKHKQSLQERKE